ncbi:MAG: alanine racemase [Nitrospinota bacterium]
MSGGRAAALPDTAAKTHPSLPPGVRTAAFVDLDVLSRNYRAFREAVGGREVMAVVKAEGYGHGAVEAAGAFHRAGARWFGVAAVEEAEALRSGEEGASLGGSRILLMSGVFPACAPRIAALGLDAAVWDLAQAEALSAASLASGRRTPIHPKVDSGMGRLGIAPAEAVDFFRRVSGLRGVEVAGLMSHLSRADEEGGREATAQQFEVIRSVAEALERERLLPPLLHCANSAGGLLFPEAPGGLVRAGIALYGAPMGPARHAPVGLAVTWKASVIQVKAVGAGGAVGYGGIYRRKSPGQIAIAAAGYGDGYPRLLSNRGEAILLGKRVPVVGRVSMDMLALDVTGIEGVRMGDEAVLLGAGGKEVIAVADLASRAETISYEIFCGIGLRVPRIYVRDGKCVGARRLGGGPPDPRDGEGAR